MNLTIKKARTILPDIPEEVFSGFIAPLINNIGWPFNSANSHLGGTDWLRIFHPLALSEFSELKWERQYFFLDKNLLHPNSQTDIDFVIMNKTHDIWALLGRDSEVGRKRLAWHEEYTMSARRFPAPITMAQTSSGLKVLDGHHRLASLFGQNLHNEIKVDAWVGEKQNKPNQTMNADGI